MKDYMMHYKADATGERVTMGCKPYTPSQHLFVKVAQLYAKLTPAELGKYFPTATQNR